MASIAAKAAPEYGLEMMEPRERNLFATHFDHEPFLFHHRLSEHQLFQPEYILQLARRMASEGKQLYCSQGEVGFADSFDKSVPEAERLTPLEALDQLSKEQLLMKLPRISTLPEYQQFMGACFDQILAMCSLPAKGWDERRNMSVFMATPGRVTPFHIDADPNFLCQIVGTKTVWIANADDREILTEEELESFWRGDGQSAQYKPVAMERAYRFILVPGTGVHIPINFPHWVENGAELSISVSLNVHPAHYRKGAVYRFNSYLRQMHLKPVPPGRFELLDSAKQAVYEVSKAVSKLHHH